MRNQRWGRVAVCLAVCVELLVGSTARADAPAAQHADGPPPEAKQAFVDGKAAFERGDYTTALQLFERAALIAPAPSLYYNIGVTNERLNRFEDSAIAFEKYLELVGAPQNDEERTFQTNLRARAQANHERARQPAPPQPAAPPPTPPQPAPFPAPPPANPAYPAYSYVPMPPPIVLNHHQRLARARRHRNNGIALLVVGTVFAAAGAGLCAWGATTSRFQYDNNPTADEAGVIVASTVPMVLGISLLIPGAVATAHWQRELRRERSLPDDGAAAQRAALELNAPSGGGAPPVLAMPMPTMLSTPVITF